MTLTLRASLADPKIHETATRSAIAALIIDSSVLPNWVTPDMNLHVPLPNRPPRQLAEDRTVAWAEVDSSDRIPLIATSDSGLEAAYDWSGWRTHVLTERYATWRRRPWHTRSPISYRVVPDRLRHAVAEHMCKSRDREPTAFPSPTFDAGFEALRHIVRPPDQATRPSPRICLTHDIDTAGGFRFVREIAGVERSLGLRSSWNVVPFGERVDDDVCDWLMSEGFEIGLHGHCHDNRLIYLSEPNLRRRMDACRAFIERYDVRGFRSPSWLRNMRLMRVLADYVAYDCSCLDFDWVCPAGRGGVLTPVPFRFGRLVEIPTTIPFEAPAMVTGQPTESLRYWQPKIDWLTRVGGHAVVNTHPDPHYLGNPSMIRAYAAFLEAILSEFDARWSLPQTLASEVASDE